MPMGYPVEAGQLTTSELCRVHKHHSPRSHKNHMHHVLPRSMGGKTEPNNLIPVCPTGHYNIHTLIDSWVNAGGEPHWEILKHYGHSERYWAESAYVSYKNLGH